jgi:hypothetical protein
MMVMTVMAAVMMRLSKCGGREQQHQRENNQLLHAEIVARIDILLLLKSGQEPSL